jgi:hypothetical protein
LPTHSRAAPKTTGPIRQSGEKTRGKAISRPYWLKTYKLRVKKKPARSGLALFSLVLKNTGMTDKKMPNRKKQQHKPGSLNPVI